MQPVRGEKDGRMDAAAKILFQIESVEDLLLLKSPRDYAIASFPGDEFVEQTHGGMLDVHNRIFYFSANPESHSLYHEAAHWVLMNNGLLFIGQDTFPIFGRALDEALAELCANTLDGRVRSEVITDYGLAKSAALVMFEEKQEFEVLAGLCMASAREAGRGDDPIVQLTAAYILTIPLVACLAVKVFELEELFNRDCTKMPEAYQEFQKLWAQHGNWVVERGVASAIGERVGATLYEKGCSPKKILHEIREERGLSPMQVYWQVIVPKL